MDHFSSLPSELIFIIFKNLNLSDLNSLRFTNKRLKEISEQSVTDLIVHHPSHDLIGNYWYLSDDRKSPFKKDLVHGNKFKSFCEIFDFKTSLRRLYNGYTRVDWSNFSCCKNLEHLELEFSTSIDLNLDLPKLKLARIRIFLREPEFELNLKCEKLEKLVLLDCGNHVTISHPKIVKYLQLESTNINIDQFENLEHLILNSPTISKLDKDILSKFSKLKALEFNSIERETTMENYLHHIKKQRLVLRREYDLIIRLEGVELKNESTINQYFQNASGKINFQLSNFDDLSGYLYDEFHLISSHEDTLEHFNDRVSLTFHQKFFNLVSISFYGEGPTRQDLCSLLLDNLICLKSLYINGCGFNQSFYDKITKYEHLDSLIIINRDSDFNCRFFDKKFSRKALSRETDDSESIKIDSNGLVAKLKKLRTLQVEVEYDNPFIIVSKLFKQSTCLEILMIIFNGIYYHITQLSNGTYDVKFSRSSIDCEGWSDGETFVLSGLNSNELIVLSKFEQV